MIEQARVPIAIVVLVAAVAVLFIRSPIEHFPLTMGLTSLLAVALFVQAPDIEGFLGRDELISPYSQKSTYDKVSALPEYAMTNIRDGLDVLVTTLRNTMTLPAKDTAATELEHVDATSFRCPNKADALCNGGKRVDEGELKAYSAKLLKIKSLFAYMALRPTLKVGLDMLLAPATAPTPQAANPIKPKTSYLSGLDAPTNVDNSIPSKVTSYLAGLV